MKSWQSYSEKYELYHHSETLAWDYTQDRPYNLDSRKHITRKALYPLKIKSFDIFRLKIFIVMSRTHNMIAFQRLCGFVPTSLGKSGNPGSIFWIGCNFFNQDNFKALIRASVSMEITPFFHICHITCQSSAKKYFQLS